MRKKYCLNEKTSIKGDPFTFHRNPKFTSPQCSNEGQRELVQIATS